jgi:predicted GIY-YIG superfamily endonuclease
MDRTSAMYYVYRLFDSKGTLLYVGSSNDPKKRVRTDHKNKSWGYKIRRCTATSFELRQDALIAEREAIQNEGPIYNKNGKKGFRGWEGVGDYSNPILPSTWNKVTVRERDNRTRKSGVVRNKHKIF